MRPESSHNRVLFERITKFAHTPKCYEPNGIISTVHEKSYSVENKELFDRIVYKELDRFFSTTWPVENEWDDWISNEPEYQDIIVDNIKDDLSRFIRKNMKFNYNLFPEKWYLFNYDIDNLYNENFVVIILTLDGIDDILNHRMDIFPKMVETGYLKPRYLKYLSK